MAIDEADDKPAGTEGPATETAASASESGSRSNRRDPVSVGDYDWEAFKSEYYYDETGEPPEDESFDPELYLGFDPDDTDAILGNAGLGATQLTEIANQRTIRVDPTVDEDAFFSNADGSTTIVNRYDLEKSVPQEKKHHFREVDRYWVNKPYAFVVIFHSEKENEKKYYLIEPHLTPIESDVREFLSEKLKTAIKYSSDEVIVRGGEDARAAVIEDETHNLLERYDLYADGARPDDSGLAETVRRTLDFGGDSDPVGASDDTGAGLFDTLRAAVGPGAAPDGSEANNRTREPTPTAADDGRGCSEANEGADEPLPERLRAAVGLADGDGIDRPSAGDDSTGLDGIAARPEPELIDEDAETLTEYQIEKLLYLLRRDFIGFERIDGIKHDINVEDISCDGYNSPVFVYHSEHEQIITNVYHGEDELDEFVVKLAQRSGKGISKRSPQVDATLPDGSRSQLTLGKEVSDHGTNYTIRQFKDVPYTPIDLINWNTFSLREMAFLWLCIENQKSLIFAGGTASGKTTSLNAVSLFIPSKAKIVSIEDTREVELPQRNWIASVTRPSFTEGDKGDVDEFDLLEAALRQRPEYIVMGEIRGEEGRTLFQVMSTGHTTLTTFHADSVGEVIKRFTTDPINVSKTMFTALDLVSIQTSTRVQGDKVRRTKSLTEINHYDPENDEINVQDVYQWQAETDEFLKMGQSNTLEEIMFDRGWSRDDIESEMFNRQVVLAYLVERNLNTYTQVAATLQAFVNDPDTILKLIANDELERSLEDLREMESVEIDIDPDKESMVPRPKATEGDNALETAQEVLSEAGDLFDEYRDDPVDTDVTDALEIEATENIDVADGADTGDVEEGSGFDYGGFRFEPNNGVDNTEATTDGGEPTDGERSPGYDGDTER